MTLRDDLLPVMSEVARLIPQDLGFRPYAFQIITKVWTGKPGDPAATVAETALTIRPVPKVRDVTAEEVATSGGVHEIGDIRVGPITPQYASGGYTEAQLRPTVASPTSRVIYRISGTRAGDYRVIRLIKNLGGRSELGFNLFLRRMDATP